MGREFNDDKNLGSSSKLGDLCDTALGARDAEQTNNGSLRGRHIPCAPSAWDAGEGTVLDLHFDLHKIWHVTYLIDMIGI